MAIIPWKPFDIDKFFEDEDWFLPMAGWVGLKPAMDIYETDKDVIAEINLPGIDPEKIDISVKDGILKVSGSSEEKKEEKEKGYWRKEIRRGSFERSARLPAQIKEDRIDAIYDKGVLKIVMPKAIEKEIEKRTKIKVRQLGKNNE